jgi:2-octaprenyl-6-methoxyphenol hydroxylase
VKIVGERAVLVSGGGPVGSALALALGQAGIPVTLLEASPPGPGGDADLRPIALSASSVRIFRALGVWPTLAPHACPIRTVHVSERGCFGMVRLRAREQGVDALGQVSDAAAIARALEPALDACTAIERLRPAAIEDVDADTDHVRVAVDGAGETPLHARLLVAADGARTSLRDALGVGTTRRDYRQAALVCNVTPGRSHDETAYERFTASGPVAMLPLVDGRCGLVWTLDEIEAEVLAHGDEAAFLAALQQCFGYRLGRLRSAGPRVCFPLSLVRGNAVTAARCAFIGNAANQLHPVAGQGLNLGLRDAAQLAELVVAAIGRGEDPGAPTLLAEYARRRRADHAAVVRFTDTLARGFIMRVPALSALRSAGMLALDLVPAAGRVFARRAMGLAGPQSRLVRGIAP